MGHRPGRSVPLRVQQQQQQQQRWSPEGCQAESCASSVSTELIEAPSPGSPIASDKLYVKPPCSSSSGRQTEGSGAEEPPAAMLYAHWGDDATGHPLQCGVNAICGRGHLAGGREEEVAVWVDEEVSAVIEIGDGAHFLYDCGSPGGVFLGHRRVALQHGVRYEVRDGKMVWFGGTPFWYRVICDEQSPSPPPPWRPDSCRPQSTAAPSTLAGELRREVAGGAQLPSRSTGLHREIAGMAISPVPRAAALPLALTVPAIGSPAGSPDGSPDGSLPASPTDGIFGFSPVLAHSPHYHSSDDDSRDGASSALVGTEPMSAVASSPQLLVSTPPTPQPAKPLDSSPPASWILHVAESPRRPREDPEPLLSPTQPVSPTRLPPAPRQQSAGQRPGPPESAAATQMREHRSSTEETLHLPPAAAFVYAPPRVILLDGNGSGPSCVPRYPYDNDGVDRLIGSAGQATQPTQPDSEPFCATAETALSSDFSQAFLSPPPPPPPPPAHLLPASLAPARPRNHSDDGGHSRPPFRRRRSREAVDNLGSDSDSDTPRAAAGSRRPKAGSLPRRTSGSGQLHTPGGAPKFAVPPSMSSRHRPLRHAPLALQPSSQIHSPGAIGGGTPTPTVRRAARSAERSSLLLAPSSSSANSRASPTVGARRDGFPDDSSPLLAMPLTALSAPRSARHRWPSFGTSPVFPPASVDRTPLSAAFAAAAQSRSQSPAAAHTPSRPGPHGAQLPRGGSSDADEQLPISSPALPQPSALLQSQSEVGGVFDPPAAPPETPESCRPLAAGQTTPVTAPTPRTRTSLRPSSDDDDDDEIKPRLITRRSGRPALHPKPALSAGTAGDADGWINVDSVRSSASAARPSVAAKSESSEPPANRRRQSTPLSASRTKSLRESLRKLPGNRGLARTGLTSRRTAVRKPVSQRAATDTSAPVDRTPPPPAPAASAPGSRTSQRSPPTDDAAPPAKRATRASHRALDLGRPLPAPRLTRQQSASSSGTGAAAAVAVTVSGYHGGDRDRLVQQLQARGFAVTENPLVAQLCVLQGRLARTLKVLCALARGTPVVTAEFVAARAGPPEALGGDLPLAHLVADPATEREWGMTLADTLARARGLAAGLPLLGPFCVYICDSVAQPSPASLAVMVRAAGGAVFNDLARQEELLLLGGGQAAGGRRASSLEPSAPANGGTAQLQGGSSSSSSEPDDDSDEDWCMDKDRPAARRQSSTGRLPKPPPTPRLPAAEPAEPPDDGVVSEPSLILYGAPESKRRRVDGADSPAAGPAPTVLDPRCNRSDLELVLDARKAELRLPSRTRLVVVAADPTPELCRLWSKHRAIVVDPEQIIQSIVHCALQFQH